MLHCQVIGWAGDIDIGKATKLTVVVVQKIVVTGWNPVVAHADPIAAALTGLGQLIMIGGDGRSE